MILQISRRITFAFTSKADNIPPVITCPDDITQTVSTGNQNGAVIFWSPPVASDNSGEAPTVTIVSNPDRISGSLFEFREHTVIYQASDSQGNTATCSFTVTVGKRQAPKAVP